MVDYHERFIRVGIYNTRKSYDVRMTEWHMLPRFDHKHTPADTSLTTTIVIRTCGQETSTQTSGMPETFTLLRS
jgi:hypothetical protein